MAHILVAEDDKNIREMIIDALRDAHFTPDPVASASDASYKLKINDYDLAILDWCFAGEELNGIDLTRQICDSDKDIPVLILTGKGNLIDRVTGLHCGADDYLTKPFYLPELVARVHTLLRRGKVQKSSPTIKMGELVLNRLSYKVTLNERQLRLNNKEFQLLQYLLEKNGDIASRGEILEKVWGDTSARTMSNTVDVHIRRLRSRLGKYSKSIRTVRGVGYCFDPC